MDRAPARAADHEVERMRLLSRLPDAPGFVVHLRAPFGFGKTWLARAHLRRLAAAGWRTLEVSVDGRGVRPAVAARLDLPVDAPAAAARDALWRGRTAVLLDDVTPSDMRDDVLGRLLTEPGGVLLLASRGPLAPPEFARLSARGRLLTLMAGDLAFDEAEAAALFGGDRARAAAALESCGGWPLLLAHLAVTGHGPDHTLVAAAAESALEEDAWEALLQLVAVPDAPAAALGRGAEALLASGLATAEEGRLRPIGAVATACLHARRTETLAVISRHRGSFSALQLATAYERLGARELLAGVMDAADEPLAREDPRAVLRWYELTGDAAGTEQGARRRLLVGNALAAVGRTEEAGAMLAALGNDPGLAPDLRLQALGDAIYVLAGDPQHHATARTLLATGSALAADASAERRGLFFSTASVLDFRAGDLAAAKRLVERGLRELPAASPLRFGPLINLAVLTWNLEGDLEGRIRLEESGLELCRKHYPDHVVGVCRDLAHLSLYLGRAERARAYLEEARSFGTSRPIYLLDVEAMTAGLDGDLPRLHELAEQAAGCGDASMADAIAWRYLGAVRVARGPDEALAAAAPFAPLGPFATVAAALAHLDAGRPAAAAELLEGVRPDHAEREFLLEWAAARYLLTRAEADLDALVGLTRSGAAVLPALVPLAALPRRRADLARHYPLEEVLRSGWREAATARSAELPPLRVDYLGCTEVRAVGTVAPVSGRPRDLLALLLLRLNRREIGAALWPDADKAKVRNNLAVQYSLLRHALEPWGTRRYLPDDALEHVDADVWRLQAALRARDADAVLALYRGPFAPGVDVQAIDDARTDLERAVVDLLIERSRDVDPETAVGYLRRVMAIDGLNEPALEQLLDRLVRTGRVGEAELRYRRFAADLMREVGAEPLPSTRARLDQGR